MSIVVFLSLAGAAIAAYVVMRRSDEVPDKYDTGTGETGFHKPIEVKRNTPPKREKHFYGATIRTGVNCCDAARKLEGHRFLMGEEPRLPLPDCERDDCRCIMKPIDDRRSHFDRRGDSFSAYGDYRDNWHPRRRHKGPDRRRS